MENSPIIGSGMIRKSTALKFLLMCGVLSSLLYIGTDILAATLFYPGYSYTSQQVSELSAIGAPTRPLWVAMGRAYGFLMIAFGIGVWLSAGRKHSLRIAGILMVAYVIIGIFWPPMHQRGSLGSSSMPTTDVLHLVFTAATVLLIVLFIAFGSGAVGKRFRIYSIGTIVAMLVAGGAVGTQVQAIAAGRPTPWFGLIERVSVYAPMLWVAVLATMLLQAEKEPGSIWRFSVR